MGTQPEGQVEAAGEKLWEIQSAGSMPRSQSVRGNWLKSRLVQVNVRLRGVLIRQHRKAVGVQVAIALESR